MASMLDRSPFRRVPASAHQFVFDATATAALHLDPGETVIVETLDCFSGRLTEQSPPLNDDLDVLEHIGGRYNPVSAPIFVRGAEPGDTLAVDIVGIEIGVRQGFAVTHVARDWARDFGGASFADLVSPATIVAAVEGDRLELAIGGRIVRCKAQPMIGTIGTAPAATAASSLLYDPLHGGNLDCPMIKPGATVLLPVNVPGALLSLGDVHALMGEGEITGTALETSADVTIRVRLLKQGGVALATPRLVDETSVGSIGCGSRSNTQENIRSAVLDLVAFLRDAHQMAAADALQLINLFGGIVVNQSVAVGANGWSSVLVKVLKSDLARFSSR